MCYDFFQIVNLIHFCILGIQENHVLLLQSGFEQLEESTRI